MTGVKKTKVKDGQRLALFGGYVRWDSRKKDSDGYPIRTGKELRVWLRADLVEDDCGSDTKELVKALKEKAGANRRNVEVQECWRY